MSIIIINENLLAERLLNRILIFFLTNG